jgi:hypothetical protein
MHLLHFDAMQGKNEQRSEAYMQYGERAAEFMTRQSAKSYWQSFELCSKAGRSVGGNA